MMCSPKHPVFGAWHTTISRPVFATDATMVSTSSGYTARGSTTSPTPGSAPIANNDSYALNEDTVLAIAAPGVLSNDSDPTFDPLQALLVSGPTHAATFVLNPDGSFSYTPAANYAGADAFTYRACDPGMLCDNATVSLNIAQIPDTPIAVDDSPAATATKSAFGGGTLSCPS